MVFQILYQLVYVNFKNIPGPGWYMYGTIIKIIRWYIGASQSIELVLDTSVNL